MKMDARRAFQLLADGLSRNGGDDFYPYLVRLLSTILNADVVLVGRVVSGAERIRTLAVCIDGELADDFEYGLAGTPCGRVLDREACTFRESVTETFPDDEMLSRLGAEAYLGVPMTGPDDSMLGIVVAIYRHPVHRVHLAREVLRITAARAGAELVGRKAEYALARTASQMARLNHQLDGTHRALTLLRLVNRAVIRLQDETALLQEVCRLAVENGGYRLAWTGLAPEGDEQCIVPQASAGRDAHLLADCRLRWSDEPPTGLVSQGRCLDDSQALAFSSRISGAVCATLAKTPALAGEVALPLEFGDGLTGVLVLMQEQAFRISDDELELLGELAGNLSFGLQTLRARRHQERTQRAVLDVAEAVSARSDDAFFDQLAKRLVDALGADAVFISRIDDSVPLEATLMAGLVNGAPAAEFRYGFSGLPCERTFRHSEHVIVRGVKDQYPRAAALVDMPIEAYAGRRLEDASGDAIGMIFVLFRTPLLDPEPVSYLLRIFAAGASAELERRRSDAHIRHLAYNDPGTGLPNRVYFMDRLQAAIGEADRCQSRLALMFLDLNRFKEINDSQGHDVGDRVLSEVATRFRNCLGNTESLARLGGDEFVVMVEKADEIRAAQVVGKLLSALSAPVAFDGHRFNVEVSIGVAFYPEDGDGPRELLKHTDIAMYHAKESGSGYRFYAAEMGRDLRRRLVLATRLNEALAQGALQLCYQPCVLLEDGSLMAAEVLCRWYDPGLGWVSPSEFIAVAEERGMVGALGEWVLREACRQLRRWRDQGLAAMPGRLYVNLAAAQFEDPGLAGLLCNIVDEAGLSPHDIGLELTESGFMADPEQAIRITNHLRRAGFALSIDDFGTGYSSLAYLKRFAVQSVKIDMSFVSEMLSDSNDHAIVATIIAMADRLGMQAVAEGVETAAQVRALRDMGCRLGQGYLYSRPLSGDDFAQSWLTPREASLKSPVVAQLDPLPKSS